MVRVVRRKIVVGWVVDWMMWVIEGSLG